MLIVILTAIIGTRLVKSQGLNAIKDVQSSFINGGNTANSLINGALILVAGVLLLTPGFFYRLNWSDFFNSVNTIMVD